MGLPVQEYLIQFRINKAKEMLTHTYYNISEIAFSVGYNDYYAFIKSFKKKTGLTPKQYRKMNFIEAVQFLE
jgi:YesN/AraC family two-component response regulator